MKTKKWELLKSTYVLDSKWMKVKKNSYRMPNGDVVPEYYIHKSRNGALIFCLTKDKKVLLVKEWRPGIAGFSLNLPVGGIDKDDKHPVFTAKRELLEETGYKVKSLKYAGKLFKDPCRTKSYNHLFFGKEAKKYKKTKFDLGEDVELVLVSLKDVLDFIKSGKINCALCISGIYLALHKMKLIKYS